MVRVHSGSPILTTGEHPTAPLKAGFRCADRWKIYGKIVASEVDPEAFFVPKSDRSFRLSNDQLSFFTIDGVDSTLNMPFSIDQIYKIYEDKGDYHLSARKEVVGSSGNMILSTLSGTIYASAKKEGGTLSTYLHSILSQNNIKTSLPPNGPLLNNDTLNQPNLPPWKILKLFKGELKCKTTFKGKNYYTFMKKL